ncbi:MAG: sensor histidine kinase, partial [Bdellovibrionales bacterium]
IIASMVEKKGMDPSLLKSALQRIEEIVDDLRVQSDTLDSLFNSHDLFRVDLALKQVVSEKLVEHPLRMISAQKVTRCFAAGSESQFKRVVSNLLNNAIEASHEDQPINIDLKCDGGRIILRVRDRGCGIPEEHKARLFTKGFTLGKASGSGLGLYHARRVVSAMGGGIELSPAEGGGTEVTLALRSAH